MDYFKIYVNFFELEILSRGLIHVFTLTNKNRQKIELNGNKNKFLDRGEEKSALKTVCFIT
jgi:hypothetical protein